VPESFVSKKNLSKKYHTNVNKLIRAWKKGLNDLEIARVTGIDPVTLQKIREDIELLHRRLRLTQKKEAPVITGSENPEK